MPIFGYPRPKNYQLIFFLNWYRHAKNQAISLMCSGDYFLLKILQSDWQRAFWPVSQEQDFYQIYIMYRNTANKINNFI